LQEALPPVKQSFEALTALKAPQRVARVAAALLRGRQHPLSRFLRGRRAASGDFRRKTFCKDFNEVFAAKWARAGFFCCGSILALKECVYGKMFRRRAGLCAMQAQVGNSAGQSICTKKESGFAQRARHRSGGKHSFRRQARLGVF
jgi:hypothetical protein